MVRRPDGSRPTIAAHEQGMGAEVTPPPGRFEPFFDRKPPSTHCARTAPAQVKITLAQFCDRELLMLTPLFAYIGFFCEPPPLPPPLPSFFLHFASLTLPPADPPSKSRRLLSGHCKQSGPCC